MTILVTGGAGFIGINFVKYLQQHTHHSIAVIDKMGYASNKKALADLDVNVEIIDIADAEALSEFFDRNPISYIFHFAAESHVDNSIKDSQPFVQSNVVGTVNLLDQAVKHKIEKFVHISTDEVFGEVTAPGKFNEHSNICPRNPYSASKAAAEHFVIAYGNTHKLPYVIVNSSNNYGPYQYPEKLIPLTVTQILKGQQISVYGQGLQIRDWIHVSDTCRAIYQVFVNGKVGERYCIGGDNEVQNLDLVHKIIDLMQADPDLITFVTDRPGHDARYATDISKIQCELGWQPEIDLESGLIQTIEWIKNYENRI
jgi:dTDP-glucose 4,6-dehydratase